MHRLTRYLIILLLAFGTAAMAQPYPAKAVRIIVPFAAGSLTNGLGRLLAKELTVALGQSFIVDNKPGASAIIGAQATAQATPDGYTLLLTTNTPHAANASLFKKLPYEPIKDFTPIARIGYYPFVLVVNPTLPVTSVKELIAYARANPGKLSYATASSMSLVSAEMINVLAKTDLQRVAYKSSPQSITDLLAGEIQVMVGDLGTTLPQIKSGKLRALGVTTARRTTLVPDIPTIAESGLPNFDLIGWVGLVAPARTPNEVVKKIHDALAKILTRADMQERLAALGCEPALLPSDQFALFIKQQIGEWAKKVTAAKIEPE